MSGQHIYGIDLGTTYSSVAHVDEHGKAAVLPNSEGELTTPSVIYFESPDNVVVGQAAKDVVRVYPERCVETVKRVMGDPHWQVEIDGQTYKPQDVSSFLLRKLAEDAQQVLGRPIEEVVVTCPAYFGVNEREATRQAGALAGLDVVHVLPEPTAAALAYGMEMDEERVVLVYDLGGGTFDVTVIEVRAGEIRVVCTGGDHQLGGKDWDEAIVDHFAHGYAEALGLPADELLDDAETYQDLLRAAERAKKALSHRRSVVEPIRFEGERVSVELSRETFETATAHLLERTLSFTDGQIEEARSRGIERVDRLLLVGGSTSMPQVLEAVRARYPFEVQQFDPVQAVARGAALYGHRCYLDDKIGQASAASPQEARETVTERVARLEGMEPTAVLRLTGRTISNVSPKSFGIVLVNASGEPVVSHLIEVNEPVPQRITRRFPTHEEGQFEVDLRCMESTVRGGGEVPLEVCRELGRAVLELGRPVPRGTLIEVTFDLSADGRLTVHGREPGSGISLEARFVTSSVLELGQEAAMRRRNLGMKVA